MRYFDTESHITYENNAMMNAFANIFYSLDDTFNPLLLRGQDKQTVSKAILLVDRPNKSIPQPIFITHNDSGEVLQTYNFDTMLKTFLASTDKQVLQALENQKEVWGYFSLLHTLHELILQRAEAPAETMSREIDTMFGDERTFSGLTPNHDVHYKRVRNDGNDYTAPTPHAKRYKVEL